jgi:hypothetical protein
MVGIHTTRPPARAHTSTASGLMPPTLQFSVMAPWTSHEVMELTTAARSAVIV